MRAIALAIFVAVLVAGSSIAMACSEARQPVNTKSIDLSWVHSDLVVFGVDEQGLYQARLNQSWQSRLVSTRTKFNRGLAISPDGRYLVYSTSINEHGDDRIRHIFDRYSRKDRIIPGLSRNNNLERYEFLGFSPDGSRMAWQDNGPLDSFREAGSRPRLLIFSANTLDFHRFSFPAPANPQTATSSCFTSQWSPGGESIYSNYQLSGYSCSVPIKGKLKLAYFKTDVASGKQVLLSGDYVYDVPEKYSFRVNYVDGGKTLHLEYACLLQRNCGFNYGDKLVSGESSAWFHHVWNPSGVIDGAEELFVQTAHDSSRKVASGWSSSCSGTNIQMLGWLEKGKYLLYKLKGNTYIYGVEEHRKSLLPQLSGHFNWLPLDRGGGPYNMGGGNDSILVSRLSD